MRQTQKKKQRDKKIEAEAEERKRKDEIEEETFLRVHNEWRQIYCGIWSAFSGLH